MTTKTLFRMAVTLATLLVFGQRGAFADSIEDVTVNTSSLLAIRPRQTHFADQVGETRIGTQPIEGQRRIQEHQAALAILIRLVQPGKGLVFLVECGIDGGELQGQIATSP